MHKTAFQEKSQDIFHDQTLTLQVLDFKHLFFCLPNGHFVETRIVTGFPAVKGRLSTKLSTAIVDI